MRITRGRLTRGKPLATSTSAVGRVPPPMPLPTTPYTIFQHSIVRARNLVTIHGLAHGARARPHAFLADAHRAAIVLAVSALDAFVRTFVIDRIVSIVGTPAKTISPVLRERIKGCLSHDSVLDSARAGDITSRVERALRDSFDTQSFQGVEKITEAMKLLGYRDVFETMAAAAGVNERNLKKDLGTFTQRRHLIAHRGDFDLDQTPPAENKILKEDVLKCIKTVELVAREIAKLA